MRRAGGCHPLSGHLPWNESRARALALEIPLWFCAEFREEYQGGEGTPRKYPVAHDANGDHS